jgi:hypothetical protein
MFRRLARNSLIKAALLVCACGVLMGIGAACCPVITSFIPERGNVGTEVTIKGKRFEDSPAENTVKFSGVTVATTDITSASETEIKAKVPVGARTGLISVKNKYCTGESEKNFVVEGIAKWTFMVYLDADNNLEPDGIRDFLEMASIGSTAGVNIVVQMDRISGYDTSHGNWTGTRRFLIQKNDTPSVTPLQDLGEQNMGDPNVLQDFVEWTITHYSAEHYALSIWNHGGGWRFPIERSVEIARFARSRGETPPSTARAVASDNTDNDELYMKEVQIALETAKERLQQRFNTAVKLDVVGFDACLMGMVEVAYALRNVANYVVGSEETEPLNGWPYNTILGDLSATPTMSPAALAGTIVTRYGQSYSSGVTQSAVDVGKLADLASKIDVFTERAITEWNSLKTARTGAREYHDGCVPYPTCWGVDLWDFADRASTEVTSLEIKAAAGELKKAIDDFVIQEHHSSNMAGSHGVAIYFPPSQTVFNNDPEHTGYEESNTFMPVDFIKDHTWDNWLKNYYPNIP